MKKFLLPLVILLVTFTINAQQFIEQTSGTTNALRTVSVVNANIAWIAGASGTVLRTTDGGTTWTNVSVTGLSGTINNIYGYSATLAFASANPSAPVAEAELWRTSDGGTTWTKVLFQDDAGDVAFFNAVVMFDANNGFCTGDPVGGRWTNFKTTDGGLTWDSTGMFLPQVGTEAGWNNGIQVMGDRLWYGTSNSKIYYSTNRGASFTAIACPVGNTFAIWFTSPTTGMVAGSLGSGTAVMAKTTDGGATWTTVTPGGTTGTVYSVMGKGDVWYHSRSTGFYRSTDFGATWASAYTAAGTIYFAQQSRNLNEDIIFGAKASGGIFKGLSLGLPVELTSFTASVVDNGVVLNWTTATEINNQGFEVQRSVNGKDFNTVGFVKGNGTTTEAQKYSYFDAVTSGKYTYRLKQMDFNGTFEYTKTVEVNASIVSAYDLIQNYPNPFNPSTTISYAVKDAGLVTLKVYNVLGDEVATLVNEVQAAGMHDVRFDASSLSTGVYFYTLNAGNFTATKKMILTK